MSNECNEKYPQEEAFLEILEKFFCKDSKSVRYDCIGEHCYMVNFSQLKITNPYFAIRSQLKESRGVLVVTLKGILEPINIKLQMTYQKKESQIFKAIKLAIKRRKNPDDILRKKVASNKDGIQLNDINDSLSKLLKRAKCLPLKKIIFPYSSKNTLVYHRNITFDTLKELDVQEITLQGRHFVCDYENLKWIETTDN